jgi:outer membrane protein OmpA-like peptidoglycan-associated protein
MNIKLTFTLVVAAFIHTLLSAQSETYTVKKAWFSTDKYDEFSPVGFKSGIVFCTNKPSTKIMGYSTEDNKGFVKINFIDSAGTPQPTARLFSKKLSTKFNDGPVTFNSKGDTIYYSRNIIVDGKVSDISSLRNKLGIYYSVFDGSDWTKTRDLRINSEWYNITTPWLSPDGKRLYFASDKPGGYGGSDLYYSQWKNDYWEDPVNMGQVINTKGNESYPFINAAGEFFFSSDGHPGFGGKDIFYARYGDTCWLEPICLDTPVNSQYDDFGIFTDTLMQSGYFSSNRDKSIDIFQFRTNFHQAFYNSVQQENNYCYIFSDSGSVPVDTTNLQYRWSFGDKASSPKPKTTHCFQGPGIYTVRLDIVEKANGRLFFTKLIYDLKIIDIEQAYINSPVCAVKGEEVSFDGLKSYLPGFKVISYAWDFGDKDRSKGEKVTHVFKEKGKYSVNLELALRADSGSFIRKTGISRKIMIVDNAQEMKQFLAEAGVGNKMPMEVKKSSNTTILPKYSAETDYKKDAVFRVELLSSKTKVDIGKTFRNIPSVYTVKESLDQYTNEYSYSVEQQLTLMATYPTYLKMAGLGYANVKVKMVVLMDPAERELNNLIRINGAFADTYFDFSDKLTSNAFIMLDQIVKFMNRYPSLKLEVGVHSDNAGSEDANLKLSQKRAQMLTDYLINRGVNAKRLVARGYGGAKPIASNFLDKDKKLNRRIDFTIISR